MIRNSHERLTRLFSGKVPDVKNILGVYAIIVFFIYSWTLFTSFYKLPSWMFYLTAGQIASIYAYSFSINLLESILWLMGILFLEFTLFLGLRNKHEFQARSILLTLFFLTVVMVRLILFQGYEESSAFVSGELIWWAIAFPAGLLISVAGSKIKWIREMLHNISDRISVFLYIYMPLSLLSLLVVLVRNIFQAVQ